MCIALTRQRPSRTPLSATTFSTSAVMFTKSIRAGTFIVRCTVWDRIPEATTSGSAGRPAPALTWFMGHPSGKPEAGSTQGAASVDRSRLSESGGAAQQQATSGERSGIHTRKASGVSEGGGAAPLRLKNKRALFVVLLLAALIVLPLTVNGARKQKKKRANTTSTSAIRPALPAGCAGTAPAPQNDAFELRAVELVNRERAAVGLPPLRRVEALSGSARWFARDMATQDYFAQDHDTYRRERGTGWCAPATGARGSASSTRTGARWPRTSPPVTRLRRRPSPGWMGSPTHRTKMLAHGQWETGVGYWRGGCEGHYWVQDFGRRAGRRPRRGRGTP